MSDLPTSRTRTGVPLGRPLPDDSSGDSTDGSPKDSTAGAVHTGRGRSANPAPPHSAERTRRSGTVLPLAVLAVLLAGTVVGGLATGAVDLSPGEVLAILASKVGLTLPWSFSPQEALVLLNIRLPRVLLGVLVGAGLSVSGAAMQGLFRNPLADPGLIGVSSGAALGAVSVIVLLPSFSLLAGWSGAILLPLAAFAGGVAATLVVYRLATAGGRTSVATMLLAGIAINAVAAAGTGMLTFVADDDQLRDLTFWTLGSLGGATWSSLAAVAPCVLLCVIAAPFLARPLNAMLLGESEARHLGIHTEWIKRIVIAGAALAVGASVAVAGIIGFLGLVVPHLLRLAVGPDHRVLLPGSALLGAALLVAADMLSRIVVSPAELPIGIVTALVGGPFFLWLLLRQRSNAARNF